MGLNPLAFACQRNGCPVSLGGDKCYCVRPWCSRVVFKCALRRRTGADDSTMIEKIVIIPFGACCENDDYATRQEPS
jgi:hypothetical protein